MTDLSKVPTKVLFRIRNDALINGEIANPRTRASDYTRYGLEETISREELKAELDTREHILSKKEAKRVRQQAAKKKK